MFESARPLQAAQIAAAREVAAKTGLVVESRDTQASLATIRTVATAAGALIALGVLAMVVGLIRAEAAGDVRTRTAIGAARTTRRTSSPRPPAPWHCWARCSDRARPTWPWPPRTAATSVC
jgi:putative ABC transport system permease protein